jgi:TDG/mug DNA glycosylase family protein
MPKLTAAELAAARTRTIPDVIAQGLAVLFCGINPGLYSAATGHHFARPGNRFWPALHKSGFTPRQLRPDEQDLLPSFGLGVTNVVARATARADELTVDELRRGAARLTELAAEYGPRYVAVVGISAYRTGFNRPQATVGEQGELIAASRLWVLPNPSGLNAHYQLPALIDPSSNGLAITSRCGRCTSRRVPACWRTLSVPAASSGRGWPGRRDRRSWSWTAAASRRRPFHPCPPSALELGEGEVPVRLVTQAFGQHDRVLADPRPRSRT